MRQGGEDVLVGLGKGMFLGEPVRRKLSTLHCVTSPRVAAARYTEGCQRRRRRREPNHGLRRPFQVTTAPRHRSFGRPETPPQGPGSTATSQWPNELLGRCMRHIPTKQRAARWAVVSHSADRQSSGAKDCRTVWRNASYTRPIKRWSPPSKHWKTIRRPRRVRFGSTTTSAPRGDVLPLGMFALHGCVGRTKSLVLRQHVGSEVLNT